MMRVCLLSSLVFCTLQLNAIKKQNKTKNQIWEKGSYKGGIENYNGYFPRGCGKKHLTEELYWQGLLWLLV